MSATVQSVWAKCLDSVSQEVSGQAFQTWFEPLKPVSLEQKGEALELLLELPSRFYHEWLEKHYNTLLNSAVRNIVGPSSKISFRISERDEEKNRVRQDLAPSGIIRRLPSTPVKNGTRRRIENRPAPEPQSPPRPRNEHPLNKIYTFESFIEGDCNRLARSAALAIAQRPGQTSFNPFLIYGGVGLGKTHLVQAIANHAHLNGTASNIVYVSSEQFTAEFVRAIQSNQIGDFTQYYRQTDLLIVDDVQFFSGKEKTQEEFFHVFNDLHQRGKQVVLCADRPPREISGIEERLLSRFQWGLSADIQAPDLETRMAILRHKAGTHGLSLTPDVIEFIAQRIRTNIRELEGALTRLLAHSQLQKRELDLKFAFEALGDIIDEMPSNMEVEDFQRVVAEFYQIPQNFLTSKTRKREVANARQVAMYLCKQHTTHTLEHIGKKFGGRDHSTVIHSCTVVENRLDVEPGFNEEIERLVRIINGGRK